MSRRLVQFNGYKQGLESNLCCPDIIKQCGIDYVAVLNFSFLISETGIMKSMSQEVLKLKENPV